MVDVSPLHPMLFAKDLDRMTAFYVALTQGRAVASEDDGYCEVHVGDIAILALHALPAHIAEDIDITTPPQRRSDAAAKLRFAVSDLDPARQRAQSAGALLDDPFDWAGHRYADIVDPEGNVVQLVAAL